MGEHTEGTEYRATGYARQPITWVAADPPRWVPRLLWPWWRRRVLHQRLTFPEGASLFGKIDFATFGDDGTNLHWHTADPSVPPVSGETYSWTVRVRLG